MFKEDSPFNAWGGVPGSGPGLSTTLQQRGFSNEDSILKILPNLDPVQQVQLDIALNHNGVGRFPQYEGLLKSDAKWKLKLIDVFQGRENNNPNLINLLIKVVKRGIASHNRSASQLTGSDEWNQVWTTVYHQWLKELIKLSGENNG